MVGLALALGCSPATPKSAPESKSAPAPEGPAVDEPGGTPSETEGTETEAGSTETDSSETDADSSEADTDSTDTGSTETGSTETDSAGPPPARQPDPPPTPDEDDDDWWSVGEIYVRSEPYSMDVDGDGTKDRITIACEDPETVRVGEAKAERELGLSDMVGCAFGVVDLDPSPEGIENFVLYIGYDHEEVGPPIHVLYRYADGRLTEVWADDGDIEFRADGSWRLSSSVCFDDEGWRTATQTNRWDGDRVTTKTKREKTPLEPGEACPEDP